MALATMLVLAFAGSASAQGEVIPEPPAHDSDAISDEELIRWAANEVRIHEGRAPAPPRPPIPPASYVGTEGPLALPSEGDRDALRFLAEVGGGTLGVAVGGGLATLVVWGAIEADAHPDWMLVTVGGAAMLGAFAVTAGVVIAGDAMGGRGSFGDAFIGQLAGSVAAIPLVTVAMMNDAPALAIVSASLLPLCGAVLAYEISHANRSTTRQVPYVSPVPGGATVGLAGLVP